MSLPKIVEIKCKGSINLKIEDLNDFQGNLKDLSTENYEKLKNQMLDLGFSEPISVWRNKDKWWILNGHQRLRTLKKMKADGIVIPEIPASEIQAKDIKEAKKKVLALTSQYGQMTNEGLYEFLSEANIQFEELDDFRFPEIDLKDWAKEFLDGGDAPDENIYTDKIKAPIYTPKGLMPKIHEVYGALKYDDLVNKIEASNVDESIKKFLILAAARFVRIDYHLVAEYYSHVKESEVKKLFEELALVIVDFNSAIENGFVKMVEELDEIAAKE